MSAAVTFAAFRRLPLPDQARLLRLHGRPLAARREGGVEQRLYDVCGFFVETWDWLPATGEADGIGLLFSFTHPGQLDGWLAAFEVPRA